MEQHEIQEIESKKRYLKRYKKNKAVISRLEEKLLALDSRLTSVNSPKFSDMPKGGGTPITTEDLVIKKIELEDRIKRLKEKGMRLRSETLEEIDSLEDVRYAEVLESFFIDGYSLEEIAENEGYGVRHVYRLYSEAITFLALKQQKNVITSTS